MSTRLPLAALIFAVGLTGALAAQTPEGAPADAPPPRAHWYEARNTWLFVQTRPPGAAIELDGEWVGTSDDLFEVPPGSYTITARLAGHQPRQEPIEVQQQRITRFVVMLPRLPEEGSADALARPMSSPTPPLADYPRLPYGILSDPWGRVSPAEEPPAAVILEGHAGLVNSVEFSPNGRMLASAGADNTVRVWSIPSGNPRHVLPVPDSRLGVYSVAFSPDGKTLASCAGKIVRLWNPETGKLLGASEDLGYAGSVAFWGDGETLAVDTGGDTVTLCDARSLEVRDVRRRKTPREVLLLSHDDSVRRIAYSSDRGLVAFAGGWHPQAPGRLTIWDTRSSRLITAFETPSGCVRGVAFSADTRLLAYAVGSRIRLVDMARLPGARAPR